MRIEISAISSNRIAMVEICVLFTELNLKLALKTLDNIQFMLMLYSNQHDSLSLHKINDFLMFRRTMDDWVALNLYAEMDIFVY